MRLVVLLIVFQIALIILSDYGPVKPYNKVILTIGLLASIMGAYAALTLNVYSVFQLISKFMNVIVTRSLPLNQVDSLWIFFIILFNIIFYKLIDIFQHGRQVG